MFNSENDSTYDYELEQEIGVKERIKRNLDKYINTLISIKL